MISERLPVIPRQLLRHHQIDQPSDDRFRSYARLLQALWREEHALPIGACVSMDGVFRPLGSLIADGSESGRNFLSPEIAELAWRETIYREHGAVIDEHRLWTNLLSSQPLTFNTLGPMKIALDVATSVTRAMCAALHDAEVMSIRFEHSPGRGDASLTGDKTAFDAQIDYIRADGRRGFVAMEFKYTESFRESAKGLTSGCEAAMIASQLFIDPMAAELQSAPLQQLTREHVLAQASVSRGDYDEGRFVVIAPERNPNVRSACGLYETHLARKADMHVGFEFWSLESIVAAIDQAGCSEHAGALRERYLDWAKVDRVIEATQPNRPAAIQPSRAAKRR